jgi:hypothetical protein
VSHALTRIDADRVSAITPEALGRHVDPAVVREIVTFLSRP